VQPGAEFGRVQRAPTMRTAFSRLTVHTSLSRWSPVLSGA